MQTRYFLKTEMSSKSCRSLRHRPQLRLLWCLFSPYGPSLQFIRNRLLIVLRSNFMQHISICDMWMTCDFGNGEAETYGRVSQGHHCGHEGKPGDLVEVWELGQGYLEASKGKDVHVGGHVARRVMTMFVEAIRSVNSTETKMQHISRRCILI